MKLMTLKQYMNMSKPALIRKITKALRAMPKKRLAVLCYNITKSKLPRLKSRSQLKKLGYDPIPLSKMRGKMLHGVYVPPQHLEYARKLIKQEKKRKTKRKFSRKQLAAQRLFAKRARAGTLKRRRR